jgi:hypothetical protein
MIEAIKNSKYFKISLGINLIMLILSLVSVAFFDWFNEITWYVFLAIGGVTLVAFLISCICSLGYLFVGKIPFKYRLIPLAGNVVVFILFPLIQIQALQFDDRPTVDDNEIIKNLETDIVPFVEKENISFFFNQNWCKIIIYNDQNVSETIDSTSPEDCGTRLTGENEFRRFSDADRDFFNDFEDKLYSSTGEKITSVDTEYPINRPEQAQLYFEHKPIGIAFHLDCSFCRTRYVYWPKYTQLPPDIEGEIIYIPINSDWYRVEEDWN